MLTAASAPGWQSQLIARLLAEPRLKQFVITGCTTLFFVAYFALLSVEIFPVSEMPVTALDRWIAFQPQSLWLYASLWVYVTLVPALQDSRRDLLIYYLSAGAICAIGFTSFLFWPTVTPSAHIDWTQYPMFGPLKAVDHSGNACPSLHASFAVFSGIWLDQLLRQTHAPGRLRVFNVVWGLGILYSTIATRQHVAVDVYAGIVLGVAGAALQSRLIATLPELTQTAPIPVEKL